MSKRQIKEEQGSGAGPWQFTINESLASGESYFFDFPNMEYNKTKRYFKQFMPFDTAQVTNTDNDNAVEVEYNGRYGDTVVPNAVESYDEQGITTVRITNVGSTSISSGNIKLAVKKEPYDADDRAREQRNEPWRKRALDEIVPGGVPQWLNL